MLGHRGAQLLASLINQIVEDVVPRAWTTSTTVLIWKGSSDANECANYRPICPLCHTMKIFDNLMS